MAKAKKQKTLYSVLGIIGDIIIYPVIIISLISSVVMYVARRDNVAPSIFGYSLVHVLSESMTKSGFNKGDVLFCKHDDPYTYLAQDKDIGLEGTIIAFYSYHDKADPTYSDYKANKPEQSKLTKRTNEEVLTAPENVTVEGRVAVEDLPEKTKIIFHEIIGRFTDKDGTLFFRTKGSSNGAADSTLVRADYVVGRYVNTPNWIRGVFRFCSSQTGMIVLVVAPLGILILLQCLSLIEQTGNIITERNVIARKIKYNSKESIKANVGIEMNDVEKVKFYATSPDEERDDVARFLWKHLNTVKTREEYRFIRKAIRTFKHDPMEYWKLWKDRIKGKRNKKKLEKYMQEWKLNNEEETKLSAPNGEHDSDGAIDKAEEKKEATNIL